MDFDPPPQTPQTLPAQDSNPLLELPLQSSRKAFLCALARGPVVLTAPTGSGKSTLVPIWCAAVQNDNPQAGRTLVVEPRRVACRALYRFVDAHKTHPTQSVGYTVRHEHGGPANARIRYVTPGVALRMIAEAEAGLAAFDTIIVDEFHERGMENDLVLALLKEQRGEKNLVVMSATIDLERLAQWLGASQIQGRGRQYPVETTYTGGPHVPSTRNLDERVIGGVRQALTRSARGDVLVFLPGKAEIAQCKRALRSCLAADFAIDLLALHGGLPAHEQDRAFGHARKRRVILATNVAESSVTLPGVRVVVDSGLEKRTTYRNARSILSLLPISAESAVQRAGRAGRLGPGHAIRLWDAKGVLRPATPPEILREDLDPLLLQTAALGRTVTDLDFLDPPDAKAVAAAEQRLHGMGLLTDTGNLTATGARAARLPLDPLFANLVVAAQQRSKPALLADVVDLVATLSVAGPLFARRPRPDDTAPASDSAAELPTCDGVARIQALRGIGPCAKLAQAKRLAEARRIAAQLRARLGMPNSRPTAPQAGRELAVLAVETAPGCAFVKKGRTYGGPGMELKLAQESFAPQNAEALAVIDTHSVRTKGLRATHLATCALPLSKKQLAAAHIGTTTLKDVSISKGRFVGVRMITYGGVTLERQETLLAPQESPQAAALLIERGRLWPELFDRLDEKLAEIALFFQSKGQPLPHPRNPHRYLADRLRELGLAGPADLDLLESADLLPATVPKEELAAFRKQYPITIDLRDRTLQAKYDFPTRRVTLVHQSGRTAPPPSPSQLPSWSGWTVVYRVHSRQWKLR